MRSFITHSRTASAVNSLSSYGPGWIFSGVLAHEPILGLCGTRTHTDGTVAIFCKFAVVVLLLVVTTLYIKNNTHKHLNDNFF